MRALHRSRFVLGLLLALAAGAARAVTVEQIPTPRPTGWAVDLTGTLPPERLAELNQLGDQVKEKTGAEMAVVVVSSTDGVDAHEFATRLFNAWGISDNGLLVFAALEDHKAEIVLGKGLDGETGRRESETVMQGEMVPRFRAGNPAGAIVLGSIGCARRILHVSPINSGLEPTPETTFSPAPIEAPAPFRPEPVPYFPPQTPPQGPGYVDRTPSNGTGVPGLVAMGTLGSLLLIFGLTLRVPRCPKCKEKMTQLDEQADDAYLEPAQKVEERIGSVDYQIWVCARCGERKMRRSSAFASGFRNCPECGARTLSSTSTTVEAATYQHGGLVEVEQICANCSYKNNYTRSTPMLEERTSSSSSSSSGSSSSPFFSSPSPSSGSSSSSSSSSNSSSGSSSSSSGFSGGSSSGGGASGSW
jgi:uncharacterized protein